MMKPHFFAAAVAAALFPLSAQAQISFAGTYVGLDYQYMSVSYEDLTSPGPPPVTINGDTLFPDSFHGVNAHIGTRITPNIGIEAGVLWFPEAEKNNLGVQTQFQFFGGSLNALGYLPISDGVEVVGLLGASYMSIDGEANVPGVGLITDDEDEFGGRVGAGVQFRVSDSIFIRAMGLYQTLDLDGSANGAFVGTLGINFLLP